MPNQQILTPHVEQVSQNWFNGTQLEAPLLVTPKDGAEICDEKTADGGEGLILTWEGGDGVDFILQWSANSSFQGPLVESVSVEGATEYEIDPDDIIVGQTYYWRVQAVDTSTGSRSEFTTAWQFKFHCKQTKGKPSKRKAPHPAADIDKCEKIDFKGTISGREAMWTLDRQRFVIEMSWKCQSDDFPAPGTVGWTGGTWSIVQDPANQVAQINAQNKYECIVETNQNKPQIITLKYCAVFGGAFGVFTCCREWKVKVLSRPGPQFKPNYPIGYGYFYGLAEIMHPEFRQDQTPGSIDPGLSGGGAATHNSISVTSGKTVLPVSQNYIALGPVVEYLNVEAATPTHPTLSHPDKIPLGQLRFHKREARVHISPAAIVYYGLNPGTCLEWGTLDIPDGKVTLNFDQACGGGTCCDTLDSVTDCSWWTWCGSEWTLQAGPGDIGPPTVNGDEPNHTRIMCPCPGSSTTLEPTTPAPSTTDGGFGTAFCASCDGSSDTAPNAFDITLGGDYAGTYTVQRDDAKASKGACAWYLAFTTCSMDDMIFEVIDWGGGTWEYKLTIEDTGQTTSAIWSQFLSAGPDCLTDNPTLSPSGTGGGTSCTNQGGNATVTALS